MKRTKPMAAARMMMARAFSLEVGAGLLLQVIPRSVVKSNSGVELVTTTSVWRRCRRSRLGESSLG